MISSTFWLFKHSGWVIKQQKWKKKVKKAERPRDLELWNGSSKNLFAHATLFIYHPWLKPVLHQNENGEARVGDPWTTTMSMTISTVCSPPRWRCCHHLPPRITTRAPQRLRSKNTTQPLLQFSGPRLLKHEALGFARGLGFCASKLGFCVEAENGVGLGERSGEENDEEDKELQELRKSSTLPARFRHLTKEVPEPPLRWPWFVGLSLSLSLSVSLVHSVLWCNFTMLRIW